MTTLTTIGGLPAHPLLVHGTVVLIPLFMAYLVAIAVWPRFRLPGAWIPGLSTAFMLMAFVTAETGESLEEKVGETELVKEHADLGELLTPSMLLLTLALWAVYALNRRGADKYASAIRILSILIAIGAVGIVVEIVLIGHSGASAVWSAVP